jgi:LPS-assembly lipoprotein
MAMKPGSDCRRPVRRLACTALLAAVAGLAGCGFQLRGEQSFVFETISVQAPQNGAVAQDLRLALGAARLREPAQVRLDILSEQREKTVVGVNASGQVREFQLRIRLNIRLRNAAGQDLIPEGELVQSRDISFNESAVLAKEAEEALLYRDMQNDLVQQVLRRLSALTSLAPVR